MAKAGYEEAVQRGDLEEQARWANQVGHLCKELGQYVEALKWFRKDYEISTKKRRDADASLPINLMPTCQSMGEIYFRLNDFDQALVYQVRCSSHCLLARLSPTIVLEPAGIHPYARLCVQISSKSALFLFYLVLGRN
jgi:tetratricopeptide (TPR) repeat protein